MAIKKSVAYLRVKVMFPMDLELIDDRDEATHKCLTK